MKQLSIILAVLALCTTAQADQVIAVKTLAGWKPVNAESFVWLHNTPQTIEEFRAHWYSWLGGAISDDCQSYEHPNEIAPITPEHLEIARGLGLLLGECEDEEPPPDDDPVVVMATLSTSLDESINFHFDRHVTEAAYPGIFDPASYSLEVTATPVSVEAVDDRTVRVTFEILVDGESYEITIASGVLVDPVD